MSKNWCLRETRRGRGQLGLSALESGLWLAEMITWPGYWPLIGLIWSLADDWLQFAENWIRSNFHLLWEIQLDIISAKSGLVREFRCFRWFFDSESLSPTILWDFIINYQFLFRPHLFSSDQKWNIKRNFLINLGHTRVNNNKVQNQFQNLLSILRRRFYILKTHNVVLNLVVKYKIKLGQGGKKTRLDFVQSLVDSWHCVQYIINQNRFFHPWQKVILLARNWIKGPA